MEIDPFVNGVSACAMRAKGDRWNTGSRKKCRIHPKARAERGGCGPKNGDGFPE